MPWTAEDLKRHRAKLRAQGICTRCHKGPAREGRAICLGCHEDVKARRRKYRQMEGRCECGRHVTTGRYRCPKCEKRLRENLKKLRDRRHAAHECCFCGSKLPEPGWRLCQPCQEKQNTHKRMREALNAWRS